MCEGVSVTTDAAVAEAGVDLPQQQQQQRTAAAVLHHQRSNRRRHHPLQPAATQTAAHDAVPPAATLRGWPGGNWGPAELTHRTPQHLGTLSVEVATSASGSNAATATTHGNVAAISAAPVLVRNRYLVAGCQTGQVCLWNLWDLPALRSHGRAVSSCHDNTNCTNTVTHPQHHSAGDDHASGVDDVPDHHSVAAIAKAKGDLLSSANNDSNQKRDDNYDEPLGQESRVNNTPVSSCPDPTVAIDTLASISPLTVLDTAEIDGSSSSANPSR